MLQQWAPKDISSCWWHPCGKDEMTNSIDKIMRLNSCKNWLLADAEIAHLHCAPSALPAEDQHYCNCSLEYILPKPPRMYKCHSLFHVWSAWERSNQYQTLQHWQTTNPCHIAQNTLCNLVFQHHMMSTDNQYAQLRISSLHKVLCQSSSQGWVPKLTLHIVEQPIWYFTFCSKY